MTDQAREEVGIPADLPPKIQHFAEQREREEAEAQRAVDEMENLATPEAIETVLPEPTPSFNRILSLNLNVTPFNPL